MLSTVLATKLFASPLLIGLASLAGKRWGTGLSGLLGGLPLVAAPLVLVLWMTGGPDMAQRTATTAPIGVWATMSYLLIFAFASARLRWWGALGLGWVGYLGIAALLHTTRLDQQHWLGVVVIPVLLVAATRLMPQPASPPQPVCLPPQELLARLAAAMVLVLLLSTAATAIGPEFTGVLAGAPVAATVIPAFTLVYAGRDALLRALKGFLAGQMGFAVFFLVLAAAIPRLGLWAFAPSLAAGVLTSGAGAWLMRRWQR